MNTILMWVVPLAGVLALVAWGLLRRRPQRERRDALSQAPEPPVPAAPPAPADVGSVVARHQAATEALRQARRRKAEEEARLAAAQQSAAEAARAVAPPPLARPPVRPVPPADAAAEPVAPVLSPLAIRRNTGRTPAPPAGLAPLRPPPRPAGPPTVLVVDDSKVVRIKTGRLFEKLGWRVLLADDGQAALSCLDSDAPDLLITDVEMPGLDGFALTRRLRGHPRWARLPVIMITSSDDKHRAEAATAGVDVLLGKPYAEEALLAQAQELLGRTVSRGAPALH